MPGANPSQDLFGEDALPQGLKYWAGFLGPEEEGSLLREVERLPFREFQFQGFIGKRRTVSFGWRYDFNGGGLTKTDDMPEFLIGLRARAEAFAENPPGSFQQVLVTEYPPGAGIGWHKDRSVSATSLAFPCAHHASSVCGEDWTIALSGSPSMRSRVLFTSCAASRAPNGSIVFPAWKRFGIPLHFAT